MKPINTIPYILFLFLFFGLGRAWGGPADSLSLYPKFNIPAAIAPFYSDNRKAVRQVWCQVLQEAEHESYCPGPSGPEFSENYRLLCGTDLPKTCREDLKMTVEECPPFVYQPGGC